MRQTEIFKNKVGLRTKVNGNESLCDLRLNIWKTGKRLVTYYPKRNKFGSILSEFELSHVFKLNVNKMNKEDLRPLNESLIFNIFKTYHHPRFYFK